MIAAPFLEIIVVALGLFILMIEAFADRIDKRALAISGIFGLAAVLGATFFLSPAPAQAASGFWSFYSADPTAIFFKRFALVATILVLIMMIDYAPVVRQSIHGATHQAGLGEFFALPLFTCAGLMWMASAVDFVMIFVSLEVVTMSFYVLVAFTRRNPLTLEAGVKYLILSALSTGFLVYGITWIFGVTGETNLSRIAEVLRAAASTRRRALRHGARARGARFQNRRRAIPNLGAGCLSRCAHTGDRLPLGRLEGCGFRGVAARARALLHAAANAAPARCGRGVDAHYGNLAALPQTNLKRLLAYSSIAHAGYLLVGVVSLSGPAVSFYLVSYLLMTMLSFAVLVAVASHLGDRIEDFNGLGKRAPFLSFAMLVSMASLAGIPFTAGFLGKFFIFDAAVRQHQVTLAVIGVITVACGFYYYLKVVRAMYWETSTSSEAIPLSQLSRVTMIALIAGIFVLGVYPQPILNALVPPRRSPQLAKRASLLSPTYLST
jgi:NADH-quinone oxidoreductase subunit N